MNAVAKSYNRLLSEISVLLEQARRSAVRSINAVLTAAYWEIGKRIVVHEQRGKTRAGYGEELLARLSKDLMAKQGRGFSRQGLQKMRAFYLGWEICPTPSGKFEARSKCPTLSSESGGRKRRTASAESRRIRARVFAPKYMLNLSDEEIVTTQRVTWARWKGEIDG